MTFKIFIIYTSINNIYFKNKSTCTWLQKYTVLADPVCKTNLFLHFYQYYKKVLCL